MSQDDTTPAEAATSSNRSILRKLVIVSVLMFGFGWALVPLYRKICEVTGINVVTLRDADAGSAARNTQVDLSRTVTVEFDANTRGAWSFRPHVSHLQVHPGELVQVTYDLVNLQDRERGWPGDPELRAAAVGAAFPQTRVLLLYTTDAGGRRNAAVSGRVLHRSDTAG